MITMTLVMRNQFSSTMDASSSWIVLVLVLISVFSEAWRDDRSERSVNRRKLREPREPREPQEMKDSRDIREPREMRRGSIHYHSKRHMLADPDQKSTDRSTGKPPRELRKKPSGHLTPLQDDDIEIDEVVSVAIGPPPLRPKFDKHKKQQIKTIKPQPVFNSSAVDLVRSVLSQLGREFLTRDIDENFVFGQYVGNTMKSLRVDLRLKMQHDILDIILKYQKLNSNEKEVKKEVFREVPKDNRIEKVDKKISNNDTDESWPDFTNLAKIVG